MQPEITALLLQADDVNGGAGYTYDELRQMIQRFAAELSASCQREKDQQKLIVKLDDEVEQFKALHDAAEAACQVFERAIGILKKQLKEAEA